MNILIAGMLALACLWAPFKGPVFMPFKAELLRNADGDSFLVRDSRGRETEVRLFGVDCPEKSQAFGKAAGRFLRKEVDHDFLLVQGLEWDVHGRLISLVYLKDGRCLNRLLVEQGQAWVFTRYCKEAYCETWKDLEQQARDERLGLWQEPDPLPPWVWRRQNPRR